MGGGVVALMEEFVVVFCGIVVVFPIFLKKF